MTLRYLTPANRVAFNGRPDEAAIWLHLLRLHVFWGTFREDVK